MTGTGRSVAGLIAGVVLAAAAAGPGRAQQPEDQTPAWAEDILLRPETVFKGVETGTRRWVTAPKLTVVGGTKEQQKLVAEVVAHLNESLKETPVKGIELLKPDDPDATLRVEFVKRAQFPATAEKLGASPDDVKSMSAKRWSYFNVIYPGTANKWEIQGGTVLLSSDRDEAAGLRHNALFALCYNLGFMNRSKRVEQSIFFRDGPRDNNLTKLSPLDRKLVTWYYGHVPPGSHAVQPFYDDHWPKGK